MVENIIKKELCIVHIGMPKTGSSALQESLFKKIVDSRVSYANLPTANHNAVMYSLFSSNPETHIIHTSSNHTKVQIDEYNKKHEKLLIEGFLRQTASIEIISAEDIYHIDENGLYRMKEFLDRYFKKVIIVGYIRKPKSFMNSAFQQLVKHHNVNSFNFEIIYPLYRDKLEKFDKVFHKENVKLWEFNPNKFPNNDITMDFCSRLSIYTKQELATRSNDTISLEAISILFSNNKYGEELNFLDCDNKVDNELIRLLNFIGKKKFRFSNSLLDKVLNTYAEDIEWIEERMNISFDEKYLDSEIDINTEEELLVVSDEIINELKTMIHTNTSDIEDVFTEKPKYVSILLDILRLQIAEQFKIKRVNTQKIQNEFNILKSFSINWDKYFIKNNIIDNSTDPILHYIKNWKFKNLLINDYFNTFYYINKYKDIKDANINPLIHYYQHGIKEGREGNNKI